jgi:hypothetical protein
VIAGGHALSDSTRGVPSFDAVSAELNVCRIRCARAELSARMSNRQQDAPSFRAPIHAQRMARMMQFRLSDAIASDRRFIGMIPRMLSALIMVTILVTASHVSAACRRIGTQLDCDLAATQIFIGTQAADAPTPAGSSPPEPARRTDPRAGDHAAPAPSFGLELQDIDAATSACRDIANESFCD